MHLTGHPSPSGLADFAAPRLGRILLVILLHFARMACCIPAQGDPEGRARSKELEEAIKQERKDVNRKVKLLLLGMSLQISHSISGP